MPNLVEEGLINIERELSKEIIQTKWLTEDKTYSHDCAPVILWSADFFFLSFTLISCA